MRKMIPFSEMLRTRENTVATNQNWTPKNRNLS